MARDDRQTVRATIVIPAHNEENTIAECLSALSGEAIDDGLEIVIVCNGCTDETARRAREFKRVTVLEIDEASKSAAVRVGNSVAAGKIRIHLDADVQLTNGAARELVDALRPPALAAVPRRIVDRSHSSWVVRAYYDVWERLPAVERGLFGRGAFALSEAGQARAAQLPSLMSDDLAVSELFDPTEIRVVDTAEVMIQAPVTTADLLRRRVRVATGNAQADALGLRRGSAKTTPRDLVRMALRHPGLGVRMPVFVGVAIVARLRSMRSVRSGDFTTWLRDESSRSGGVSARRHP